ncbi:hypothetical protein OH77DRAFT_1518236 [Trametes cingulata]|nr:hypothetical protein OH77DRAFT_1518236 [Trametes cingulata]
MSRLSLFKLKSSSKPISPAQRQGSFQSNDSRSSAANYAEMMDDDNLAWGKPRKHSRR